MGSVSPLIAIHQKLITSYELRVTSYNPLWLGTKSGVERSVVEKEGIEFKVIAAGKLRRYFDLRNLIDIFKIKLGFFQALAIIKKFKPDIILTAGSFVAVPVVMAGWFLRVPSIVHQQDVRPGLANKIMAKFATKITVALEKSLNDFPKNKVVFVGNPIRLSAFAPSIPKDIQPNWTTADRLKPLLLVIGGGTGALNLNKIVWNSLDKLSDICNIIHITGKNKSNLDYTLLVTRYSSQYKSFEFLNDEIFSAMAQADLVISRAGMSALTELAYFKKPTIIVPIPNSHQEENAEYFAERGAGIYLKQNELDNVRLVREIKKLLENENLRKEMGERMNEIFCDYGGEKIIQEIEKIAGK